jgi:RNA-directed DNA polymerase
MLSALGNGVKGGKWYALIDKVFAPKTLRVAWAKVQANQGAAGVDGQSIDRFAAKAEVYLSELAAALREGTYRPQAVKRVEIPKGDGKTRPLGIPTVKDRIPDQVRDPAGGEARDRTNLRDGVLRREPRLPSGTLVP